MTMIPDQFDEDEEIEVKPSVITDNDCASGLRYMFYPADISTVDTLPDTPNPYQPRGFFNIKMVLHIILL